MNDRFLIRANLYVFSRISLKFVLMIPKELERRIVDGEARVNDAKTELAQIQISVSCSPWRCLLCFLLVVVFSCVSRLGQPLLLRYYTKLRDWIALHGFGSLTGCIPTFLGISTKVHRERNHRHRIVSLLCLTTSQNTYILSKLETECARVYIHVCYIYQYTRKKKKQEIFKEDTIITILSKDQHLLTSKSFVTNIEFIIFFFSNYYE